MWSSINQDEAADGSSTGMSKAGKQQGSRFLTRISQRAAESHQRFLINENLMEVCASQKAGK